MINNMIFIVLIVAKNTAIILLWGQQEKEGGWKRV